MFVQLLCLSLLQIARTVDQSDVQYYFYARTINETQITENNIATINFNSSKDTIFVTHGWKHSYLTEMPQEIKYAYLSSRDVNIVLIDWSNIAKENYFTARYAVAKVGQFVGKFIQFMVDEVELNLNKTGLVGFSLGAHVVGIAGRTLNGSVDRVIGLDPAGPLFYTTSDSDTLSKDDAKFVQVIHTCAGAEGILLDLGHANYWVNGGNPVQPGCPLLNGFSCSHDRSFQYYSESLLGGRFVARECMDYILYQIGACNGSRIAIMGDDSTDRSQGKFFLMTNSQSPYARG